MRRICSYIPEINRVYWKHNFATFVVVVVVVVAAAARSVQRLATGWTVRSLNPHRTRFPTPVQTSPGAHSVSCKMGTGSISGW
jgi:hypothetical protein